MELTRKYAVPRWLHTQVDVPRATWIRVDPDAFTNNTWMRMRLIGVSFGAFHPTEYGSDPSYARPRWAYRLLVDIGKSGCSDMNLVSSSLLALCANPRRQRQIGGIANMGRSYRFMTPYMLPRDEGLRVSVEWIKQTQTVTYKSVDFPVEPLTSGEVTFLAKGYGPDGYPRMLAARCDSLGAQGGATLMNSADLYNRGRDEMYITEFCYKDRDVYYFTEGENVHSFLSGHGFNFAWQVNPTNPTFTQFMPQPQHIPEGLIAPLVRDNDVSAEGPLVYFFPSDTFLDPKQALGIRVGNVDASYPMRLNICLIGELEVK